MENLEKLENTNKPKELPEETASMRQKIKRAKEISYEDVTLEELKQEWLKTSSAAGRHDAPPDAQEKARTTKQKYFEALEKEQSK